jgi:hypothetical protein
VLPQLFTLLPLLPPHPPFHPQTTARICLLQALSAVGRCRTFDAAADGYGRGEAIALGLLCRADLAGSGLNSGGGGGRAGPLLALLHGSAVNQDGRSSSLTAPNGPAQTLLVRDALAAAGSAPHAVAAVSLHGTGTPLGDPIEVGALSAALAAGGGTRGGDGGSARLAGRAVALLSSKSCYGHTEGTAGVTGALLAAMSLPRRQLAPIVNLRGLNPYVAAALGDWRSRHSVAAAAGRQAGPAPHVAGGAAAGAPLLAGTSSFGMSGVNAHALLAAAVGNLDAATLPSARTSVIWQRAGYWPAPVSHPLLIRSAAQPGAAAVECVADLAAARLAWLWDHSVRGRALLPGAAMFEAAAAAALACCSTDGGVPASLCPALAGLAILAPCLLPAAAGGGGEGGVALRCSVGRASGALEVSSGGGGGSGSGMVHLRAVAAALRAPPALQPAAADGTLGCVTAASAAALLPLRCQLNSTTPRGHNLAAVGASRQDTEGWALLAAEAVRKLRTTRLLASLPLQLCWHRQPEPLLSHLSRLVSSPPRPPLLRSYCLHPGTCDAAIHLAPVPPAGAAMGPTRVPVAAGCLLLPTADGEGRQLRQGPSVCCLCPAPAV